MIRLSTFLITALALSTVFVLFGTVRSATAAEPDPPRGFEVTRQDDGLTITYEGELFARYVFSSGGKPILWPVVGPGGKELTRGYPMRDATADEKADHPHHRSFFFTHGNVNGVDFWSENDKHGKTEHRELAEARGGGDALIVTRNDWVGPDSTVHLRDERRLLFGADDDARWIDFDITLTAPDRPATFGDTKEGTFGVRVAGTMKVDAKKGGRLVNSEGQADGEAWGQPAKWVDYYGPVEGEVEGITIMNHPTSFRFPTYWHVRTYGLFAANPFGLHDFPGTRDLDGSHKLEPGESINLRYRVLLHRGDTETGRVAERYAEYEKSMKP